MNCELCGKEDNCVKADVEGVELQVCSKCKQYGKVVQNRPVTYVRSRTEHIRPREEDTVERITNDFSTLIKNARERKGITQEELAKRLKEKESLLKHVESGKTRPTFSMARKLEQTLDISLMEKEIGGVEIPKAQSGEGFTIGDMIKVKKKGPSK